MTKARILADYVAGGVTAAEFDVLDGLTSTTAELNYVDGVTSNVQTQMDAKLPLAGGTMTGDLETATNKKVKQKGAFMQSSTHQALVLGG